LEHEHLDPAALERMLAVDRTEDQNRNLLHQLAVCPECYEVGGWLLDLYRSGALTLQFGPIDAALARSRAEAPRIWEELASHPAEERLALIRSIRASRTGVSASCFAGRAARSHRSMRIMRSSWPSWLWPSPIRSITKHQPKIAGFISYALSPGPTWETPGEYGGISPRRKQASTCRTLGGRPGLPKWETPSATSPSFWT
jgi:hypothetical protein